VYLCAAYSTVLGDAGMYYSVLYVFAQYCMYSLSAVCIHSLLRDASTALECGVMFEEKAECL